MLFFFYVFFVLIDRSPPLSLLFFFNDTAPTEISTLPLHDALPILAFLPQAQHRQRGEHQRERRVQRHPARRRRRRAEPVAHEQFVEVEVEIESVFERGRAGEDRKSTRLNSSHDQISYAVFCLKKKK